MAVILIPTINTFYSSVNMAIFQTLAFLAFTSHLRTMFTDPVIQTFMLKLVKFTFTKYYNIFVKLILRVQYQKEMQPRK